MTRVTIDIKDSDGKKIGAYFLERNWSTQAQPLEEYPEHLRGALEFSRMITPHSAVTIYGADGKFLAEASIRYSDAVISEDHWGMPVGSVFITTGTDSANIAFTSVKPENLAMSSAFVGDFARCALEHQREAPDTLLKTLVERVRKADRDAGTERD